MCSDCAVAPFVCVMNQFPLSRAVLVLPEAVSFQVIEAAAVWVVAPFAITMNWGSGADAGGMSVGFRQGAMPVSVVSSVPTCTSGYHPGGLPCRRRKSSCRTSGSGARA
jgi:hypothetical protein